MRRCRIYIKRDGKIFQQEYKIGIAEGELQETGAANTTGTQIKFYPDKTIFIEQAFDTKVVDERLRELAYLNSGIKINLDENRTKLESKSNSNNNR